MPACAQDAVRGTISALMGKFLDSLPMSGIVRIRDMMYTIQNPFRLDQGDVSFDAPDSVKQGMAKAIQNNHTHYLPTLGVPRFRQLIAEKMRTKNGIPVGSDDEVIVSNGGTHGIYVALHAVLEPGDEVICPDPLWPPSLAITKSAHAVPVQVPLHENLGFRWDLDELEKAITPKTKWFIFNAPSNPTGAAYSREELKKLTDVLMRHPQVWVLTDDMYEHLLFDGLEFFTIAQVEPGLYERTLTVNGLSKAYCMTGWRIGYAGGPEALIKNMCKLQSQSTSNPSSIGQWAGVEALNGPQDFIKTNAEKFRERRDLVVSMLNQAKGIKCPKPQGAFYVYPSCAENIGKTTAAGKKITNDEDFVTALLEEEGVATVHGAAFAMSPFFRISYALSNKDLEEACRRIQRFCGNLR